MKIPLLDLKGQYRSIKSEIDEAIKKVVDGSSFILGEEVSGFEQEAAEFCGTKSAVGVASGTDALLLSLDALGIGPGDEVITTPFTFVATTEVIRRLGAKIVFVDIDPQTCNLDPQELKRHLEEGKSKRLKAIIPVHLYGQSADLEPILELARNYGLMVIEDTAQALGAEYKGRKAGSFGETGCLSFFPSKTLGAYGDGGMVVTDDEELAEKIRVIRMHGGKNKYYYSLSGYNSRLDALQAAILRVKLKYLKDWNEKRRKKAYYYNELFSNLDLSVPFEANYGRHAYGLYTIRLKKRNELKQYLESKGISSAIYYPLPLHLQEVYRYLGYKEGDFPQAEKASREVLSLPMYPELDKKGQEEIARAIKDFFK